MRVLKLTAYCIDLAVENTKAYLSETMLQSPNEPITCAEFSICGDDR